MAILQDGQVISGGVGVIHLTEAQYLADKTNYDKSGNFIVLDDVDGEGGGSAATTTFDNAGTSLSATNVQDAIEEIDETMDDVIYADDTIAETSASVRDADTLGGQYSASDITTINNNLTHLASKLIYGGNAKKIEVMSDATNLFQLRIWVSDTKAYVLVCNSNNINLKLYDNSTWSNIWSK